MKFEELLQSSGIQAGVRLGVFLFTFSSGKLSADTVPCFLNISGVFSCFAGSQG